MEEYRKGRIRGCEGTFIYDNPLVVIAIFTFVLVGADEEITRIETMEKRRSKVATEICCKAHFKINEQ